MPAVLLLFALAQAEPSRACSSPAMGTAGLFTAADHPAAGFGRFDFAAVPIGPKDVILTFDDGPSPATTPAILDYLKSECIAATFFMIGSRAEQHPGLVRRMLAEGHSIGSHSYSHKPLTAMPVEEARIDMLRGAGAVDAAAGLAQPPRRRLFRFPEYKKNPALLAEAGAAGLIVISADISPKDWRNDPPEETLARLTAQIDKGVNGIITLHDNQPNTVKLLPMMIAAFKARGIHIVALRAE